MMLLAFVFVLVALAPFALILAAIPAVVRWARKRGPKPDARLAYWQVTKARAGVFPEEPPRGVLPMTATARAKEEKARRKLGPRKRRK